MYRWQQRLRADRGQARGEETLPRTDWTAAERWVWDRLMTTGRADLGEYPGGRPRNPRRKADWADAPPLRASVLRMMLVDPPCVAALPVAEITVRGALLRGDFILSMCSLDRSIALEDCRFLGAFVAAGAKLKGLSLKNSALLETVIESGDRAPTSLDCRYAIASGAFDLGGLLARPAVRFGGFQGTYLQFGVVGEVDNNFKSYQRSHYRRGIKALSLQLSGDLLLGKMWSRSFDGERSTISGVTFVQQARILTSIDLSFARTGLISLQNSPVSLPTMILYSTSIPGSLFLQARSTWKARARIDLRLGRVGTLVDLSSARDDPGGSWPTKSISTD